MPHAYHVGQPYIPGRTSWPDAVEYDYRGGDHELRMFWPRISPAEQLAVTRRPAEFGAVAVGPVLFFLYKFQTTGWSDAPFSWHILRQAEPEQAIEPPPLQEQERALLHIILIEATTGMIAGLRVVSLSINLSRYLHQAISAQIAQPFDRVAYDAELRRIYATTPTEALAQRAERYLVR